MNTVSSDIDVDAPVSTVYNQWMRFEEFPALMAGVEEVTRLSDRTQHWRVKVGGVEREFDAEITEQLPDERIAWRTVDGPTQAGVVTFHRLAGDTTRVRQQVDWEPEGAVEKAGAALQVDDAQVSRSLHDFERLIESNGFESGAWRGRINRPGDATGR
ncbi:Polyketide cyclase / dehydrase and lipid transport [Raineyella antarctica]|uniref:Polyketide cyclase / dehydrase and lipid transport n=1 Tax=Raineyella antarctica TaxID=1577474 RepID=A0A1G6GL72_9ACTN|nr:SRPBCC family protein [Raineyella antarctica]SDB82684.1 Polyketide cyclase / dehydrase and lipid transport [Raineyella antarctica]